jgi:hypothetical protein
MEVQALATCPAARARDERAAPASKVSAEVNLYEAIEALPLAQVLELARLPRASRVS